MRTSLIHHSTLVIPLEFGSTPRTPPGCWIPRHHHQPLTTETCFSVTTKSQANTGFICDCDPGSGGGDPTNNIYSWWLNHWKNMRKSKWIQFPHGVENSQTNPKNHQVRPYFLGGVVVHVVQRKFHSSQCDPKVHNQTHTSSMTSVTYLQSSGGTRLVFWQKFCVLSKTPCVFWVLSKTPG